MSYFGGGYWGQYFTPHGVGSTTDCNDSDVSKVTFLASDGSFIVLRAPNFGDNYKQDVSLKVRTMMDGSLRTHRKTKRTMFSLIFTELSRSKAMELRNFYNSTAGLRVSYTDYRGEMWSGYITDSPLVITTPERGRASQDTSVRAEANTVSINFEVADANSNN